MLKAGHDGFDAVFGAGVCGEGQGGGVAALSGDSARTRRIRA